ncbi:MAG: ATP-dependent RecD-like DNA helicase [Anaerolineae bacterium]|nr:ATP-dependent RecD-like DNA helicase [Anaerolineae bacterium]
MPLETFEGTVERITYASEETGYIVARIMPDKPLGLWDSMSSDGLVTVVGTLPDLTPGESVQFEGRWRSHAQYGRQFRAENVQRIRPATIEGIQRYLGSGLIKGIGPKTAARIIEAFGLETLDILDDNPRRLYEVDGIGPHRVRLITTAWAEQKEIKQVMLFLQGHGVTTSLAVKIYKTYGNDSIRQVEQDPYRLARDIYGIGFKTADKIAQALGLPTNHPRRLEAGVVYALNQAIDDGHVYLPEMELADAAAELLEVTDEDVIPAIERAAEEEMVRLETVQGDDAPLQAVYLPMYYHSEAGVARCVRRMIATPRSHLETIQMQNQSALVADAAAEANVALSEQQQAAVLSALTHKVSILTGGPGTGKTTTLRTLICALGAHQHSFMLASPTGRAAKRLSEATGQPARTIHRMLGFSPARGFLHNEDNPLPADIVIVDEASMLDELLAYSLVRAIDPRSHLLLVGDVDQLPSVGAGDVLRDLIASGEVPTIRLDVIFRQSAHSTIITNAHRINQGQMPIFPDEAEDFFLFHVADDVERVSDLVVEIVKERVPRRFKLNPLNDVQVIVPMYRGVAGVMRLNERLQQALNPPGRPAERFIGGRLYRVGDKVMQTRNNYEKEVFNGDIGRVHTLDQVNQTMTVVFDERFVTYDFVDVTDLTHAYAISVHRSQGSEYPAVVVPMVTQHYMMLQRNLLYTAITRARKLVVLVGSKKAIGIAVSNDKVSQRYTALGERVRG